MLRHILVHEKLLELTQWSLTVTNSDQKVEEQPTAKTISKVGQSTTFHSWMRILFGPAAFVITQSLDLLSTDVRPYGEKPWSDICTLKFDKQISSVKNVFRHCLSFSAFIPSQLLRFFLFSYESAAGYCSNVKKAPHYTDTSLFALVPNSKNLLFVFTPLHVLWELPPQ